MNKPDKSQLPFLLDLLDDESDSIQESILSELNQHGTTLEDDIYNLQVTLNTDQQQLLDPIFQKNRKEWLKQSWRSILTIKDGYEKIENAFDCIAKFQLGIHYPILLPAVLDILADEYDTIYTDRDPIQLAKFLFQEKMLKGTETDYYNPKNSNLICVVNNKVGIPISLTYVYILVGQRLNLQIDGCNFPGHFLARIELDGVPHLVDCFNQGQIFQSADFIKMSKYSNNYLEKIVQTTVNSDTVIERVLRNLIKAYQYVNEPLNSKLMLDLLTIMEEHHPLINAFSDEGTSCNTRRIFSKGQIVKHKRYGYRGVIVDYTETCNADELWYQSNQSQPNRNQPWYHVLVHNANHTTYAAQGGLELDDSHKSVIHPLVQIFFSEMKDGRYIRNNTPWPSE